jgi:hypothetical protein
VDLNLADGGYFLGARLNVSLPGVQRRPGPDRRSARDLSILESDTRQHRRRDQPGLTREDAMAITIKVNGRTHDVDVDGDTPLLWVLRDVLGMTGTKFGCGLALCGACTVHVDGNPTRSCVTPIDSIGASEITTIEAIGATAARRRSHGLCRTHLQCRSLRPSRSR